MMETVRAPRLREPRRCSLERLDQRLRRERFGKIGKAAGLKCSRANDWVVICGDVDNGHGNVSGCETLPKIDA